MLAYAKIAHYFFLSNSDRSTLNKDQTFHLRTNQPKPTCQQTKTFKCSPAVTSEGWPIVPHLRCQPT